MLGLYDKQGRLIHVGQAGSGFDQKSLAEIWKTLKKLGDEENPFFGEVEALRRVNRLGETGTGGRNRICRMDRRHQRRQRPKLRAPVFLGLRDDKDPKECRLDQITAQKPEPACRDIR